MTTAAHKSVQRKNQKNVDSLLDKNRILNVLEIVSIGKYLRRQFCPQMVVQGKMLIEKHPLVKRLSLGMFLGSQ